MGSASAAPLTLIYDPSWSTEKDDQDGSYGPALGSVLRDLALDHAILDLAALNNRHLHELAAIKLEKEIDPVVRLLGGAFRNDGQARNLGQPWGDVPEPNHVAVVDESVQLDPGKRDEIYRRYGQQDTGPAVAGG